MPFFRAVAAVLFLLITMCDYFKPDSPDVVSQNQDPSLLLSLDIHGSINNLSMYEVILDPVSTHFGSDHHGDSNRALSFNGKDSSTLLIAHDSVLDFSPGQSFTISLWVKADTGQMQNAAVLTKGIAEKEQYSIDIVDDRYRFTIRDQNARLFIINSFYKVDNKWHRIDAVYNDTINTMLMYVDSTMIKSNTAPDSLIKTREPITIGARKGSSSESLPFRFNGLIANICIYNKALNF